MPKDIGVLVVHGMDDQKDAFDKATVDALRREMKKRGGDPDAVAFQGAYWAGALAARQRDLPSRMKQGHTLRWNDLRSWIVAVLGDAVAYQRGDRTGTDTYTRIHEANHGALVRLREELGADKPLVVIGHSLGSMILSNFIWDEQQGRGLGRDPFTRTETLAGLVTFGSTLPLFTLMHDKVEPIGFPGRALPQNVAGVAAWHDHYDPDDVLGWPLGPTDPSYARIVKDHAIEVGGLVSSRTPMSHEGHWTDKDFTGPVAKLICDVLAAATGRTQEVRPA